MTEPPDWPMLHSLTAPERDEVLSTARRRTFARRDIIIREGDPGESMHLILSGRVVVRRTTEEGAVATFATLGPGEAFGELTLVGDLEDRTATIAALEHTETYMLSRAQLNSLRSSHPGIDQVIIEMLALQVRRLTAQVVEALYVPVRHRVARRLLDLSEHYRSSSGRSALPITQDDLAGMVGSTRTTVNQELQIFEKLGAIVLARGQIVVLSTDLLRSRAGLGLQRS